MLTTIEQVLDQKVRPQLALHHGNVKTVSYENHILKIKLLGQCSGCPSASITTEELIKKEIIEALPEVQNVFVVTEVDPELFEFAKKIINKEL